MISEIYGFTNSAKNTLTCSFNRLHDLWCPKLQCHHVSPWKAKAMSYKGEGKSTERIWPLRDFYREALFMSSGLMLDLEKDYSRNAKKKALISPAKLDGWFAILAPDLKGHAVCVKQYIALTSFCKRYLTFYMYPPFAGVNSQVLINKLLCRGWSWLSLISYVVVELRLLRLILCWDVWGLVDSSWKGQSRPSGQHVLPWKSPTTARLACSRGDAPRTWRWPCTHIEQQSQPCKCPIPRRLVAWSGGDVQRSASQSGFGKQVQMGNFVVPARAVA